MIDALDQKETAWNVKTEKWMQQNARRFRMAWMVIPVNACITSKYILRYFLTTVLGVTIVYAIFFPVCLAAIFALIARFDSGFRAYLFRTDAYSVKALSILVLRIFGHQFPVFLLFILGMPSSVSAYLARCAYYWNRRAVRLQRNPGHSTITANPSVWPPPPRI